MYMWVPSIASRLCEIFELQHVLNFSMAFSTSSLVTGKLMYSFDNRLISLQKSFLIETTVDFPNAKVLAIVLKEFPVDSLHKEIATLFCTGIDFLNFLSSLLRLGDTKLTSFLNVFRVILKSVFPIFLVAVVTPFSPHFVKS